MTNIVNTVAEHSASSAWNFSNVSLFIQTGCAIAMAIAAWMALKQLKISNGQWKTALDQLKVSKEEAQASRERAELQALREARKITVDLANEFSDKHVLGIRSLLKDQTTKALIEQLKECVSVDPIWFSGERTAPLKVKIESKLMEKLDSQTLGGVMLKTLDDFNRLEAFALAFTTRIADEEAAFLGFGYAYCKVVEAFLPLLSLIATQTDFRYKNILELYHLWHCRLSALKKAEEIANLQSSIPKGGSDRIDSIGTKARK